MYNIMPEPEDKITVILVESGKIATNPQLLISSNEDEKQRVLGLLAILEIEIEVNSFVGPATFLLLAKTVVSFIKEHQLTDKQLYGIINLKLQNNAQAELDIKSISKLASKELDVFNYIKSFTYQVVLVYSDSDHWRRIIGFLITMTTVLSKGITKLTIDKADNPETAMKLLATAITRDYANKHFIQEV